MDEERNKAVVARFDELGNGTGNLEALDELCTPDMINHALAGGAAPGIEGTRAFLRKAARSQYPARWVESHIVAQGDYVVQFGVREQVWPVGFDFSEEFEVKKPLRFVKSVEWFRVASVPNWIWIFTEQRRTSRNHSSLAPRARLPASRPRASPPRTTFTDPTSSDTPGATDPAAVCASLVAR